MRRLGYFGHLGDDDVAPDLSTVDPGAFTDLPVYAPEDPNPILIPYGTNYGPAPTAATVVQDAQAPGYENPNYVSPGLTVSPSGVVTGPNVATVPTSLAQSIANAVTGILSPTPSPRVASTPAAAPSFLTESSMISGVPNLAVLFGGAAMLLLLPALFSGGGSRRRR
jgi:hypothetical protein